MFLPQKINPLILVCSKILKHCISKLSELFRSAPGNCYVPVAWEAFQWGPTGWSALGPTMGPTVMHRVPPNGSHWVPTFPIHTRPACHPATQNVSTYRQATSLFYEKTNRPSLKPVRACALRPAKLREKVDK